MHRRLAVAAVLRSRIAIVLSFLTQLSVPFRVHPSIVALYAIVFTYAVIAVPFVVSGIVVCLALTGFPSRVSRLYAADLAGAALGCVLLIPVLDYSDGPTAVLWVCCAREPRRGARSRAARPDGRAAVRLERAVAAVRAARSPPPGTRCSSGSTFRSSASSTSRASFEARPLYEKWNSYSRVRVNGNPDARVEPQGWGLSRDAAGRPARPPAPDGHRRRRRHGDDGVRRDAGERAAPRLRRDQPRLPPRGPGRDALVIGAGGGRDVLSALTLGATLGRRGRDQQGHPRAPSTAASATSPATSIAIRACASSTTRRAATSRARATRYGLIQISLIDTWAATAAGAFVLSENSLYTAEAWTIFLRHLDAGRPAERVALVLSATARRRCTARRRSRSRRCAASASQIRARTWRSSAT